MAASEKSHCPECKRWVDADTMIREVDEETGNVIRVCQACLEGRESVGIYDANYGRPECPWCESRDTIFTGGPIFRNYQYSCKACGETFMG